MFRNSCHYEIPPTKKIIPDICSGIFFVCALFLTVYANYDIIRQNKRYGCLSVYVVDVKLLLCIKLISFKKNDLTIHFLNLLYKKYYENYGITPEFKASAI